MYGLTSSRICARKMQSSSVTSAPPTLPASQPNASLVTISKTKKQWYYPRSDYKARRVGKIQFQNCIPNEGSSSEDKKGARLAQAPILLLPFLRFSTYTFREDRIVFSTCENHCESHSFNIYIFIWYRDQETPFVFFFPSLCED